VGCGLWDADGDGMCVGDGNVMDVRIKMNVNVNPYSCPYPMCKKIAHGIWK